MEKQYSITLPLPPSVNAAWRHGPNGITFKSKEYKAWEKEAAAAWREQYPSGAALLTGRLRAQYRFVFKDNLRRDVFNFEKLTSDFLEGKFFADDSQIDEGHVIRRIDRGGVNRVECWLTEIPDTRFVDLFNREGA